MRINRLVLENFRNYKYLDASFHKDINIIYGDNAQGKTNILEAIYLLASTKSQSKSSDKEIINFNSNESLIHSTFFENSIEIKVDINLRKSEKKEIYLNNIKIIKLRDYIGKINVIFFSPDDLKIVKSSPNIRRNFIDTELCQIDRIYLENLSIYKKILEQRNILLKKIYKNKDDSLLKTLDIWDEQLVKYGVEIIKLRQYFINELSELSNKRHKIITQNNNNLDIIYKKNVLENEFIKKLKLNREKDLITNSTSIGPHRDDIEFKINNIDVKTYGSQGQQRTVALVLKLSEIEILKNKYMKEPILLLDDVLSELDKNRQKMLLESVRDVQTFITCTGVEDFINKNINIGSIFHIENGKISLVRSNNEQ